MVHFWVAQPLECSPALPIPDKPDEVYFDSTRYKFVRSQYRLSPYDEAFRYLCKLCSIDSEALKILRDPELIRPPPLAFTFSKYKKLLELMDTLTEIVQRVEKASPAVLLFQ